MPQPNVIDSNPQLQAQFAHLYPRWAADAGISMGQYLASVAADPRNPQSAAVQEAMSAAYAQGGGYTVGDQGAGGNYMQPGGDKSWWLPYWPDSGPRPPQQPPQQPKPKPVNKAGAQGAQGAMARGRDGYPEGAPNKAGLKPTTPPPPPGFDPSGNTNGGPPPPAPGNPQLRQPVPQPKPGGPPAGLQPGDPGYWAVGLDPNGPSPVHGVLNDLASDPDVHARLESMFGPAKVPLWAQQAGLTPEQFISQMGNRPAQGELSQWLLGIVNERLAAAGFGTVTDWTDSPDFPQQQPPPPGDGPPPPDPSFRPAAGDWRQQQLMQTYRNMLAADPNANVPDWARPPQAAGRPPLTGFPAGITPPAGAEAYRLGPNGEHMFRVRGQGGASWVTVQPNTPDDGGTQTPPIIPQGPPPPPKKYLGGRGSPTPTSTRPQGTSPGSRPIGPTPPPAPSPSDTGSTLSNNSPTPPITTQGPPNDLPAAPLAPLPQQPSKFSSFAPYAKKDEAPPAPRPQEPGAPVFSNVKKIPAPGPGPSAPKNPKFDPDRKRPPRGTYQR